MVSIRSIAITSRDELFAGAERGVAGRVAVDGDLSWGVFGDVDSRGEVFEGEGWVGGGGEEEEERGEVVVWAHGGLR